MSGWAISRPEESVESWAEGVDQSADPAREQERLKEELRESRALQADARLRLMRAEDQIAQLRWELRSMRASRGFRLYRLLQQIISPHGKSRLRLLTRLPADFLRIIRTPSKLPPRPDSVVRRAEQIQSGQDAFDQRDYAKAIAVAESSLVLNPKDYGTLDLKQAAHWR